MSRLLAEPRLRGRPDSSAESLVVSVGACVQVVAGDRIDGIASQDRATVVGQSGPRSHCQSAPARADPQGNRRTRRGRYRAQATSPIVAACRRPPVVAWWGCGECAAVRALLAINAAQTVQRGAPAAAVACLGRRHVRAGAAPLLARPCLRLLVPSGQIRASPVLPPAWQIEPHRVARRLWCAVRRSPSGCELSRGGDRCRVRGAREES